MTLPLTHIFDQMNGIYPMSDKFQLQLLRNIIRLELPKNHTLLQPGQICEYLYYIEKGALSCHELEADKEYCTWLMFPGNIATSVDSFNNRVPSREIIRTITDCTLHALSWQHLEDFSLEDRAFGRIRQRLTDDYHLQARTMDVQRKRPPELFFEYLKATYEMHFHLIPRKLLAAYMGISEATLYSIIKNSKR